MTVPGQKGIFHPDYPREVSQKIHGRGEFYIEVD